MNNTIQTKPSGSRYRLDIQGLRAVAVLSVLLFHIDKHLLSGGFIGVDIFFVISGYLVSGIIFRQKQSQSFSFIDFYIGRIKRIVPAYYVLIIIVLLVGSFLLLNTDIGIFRRNVFWAVLFNSNYYLSTLDNYFGMSSSENPLLHTWTLAVEMQIYFILPFLLFFLKKKRVTVLLIVLMILIEGYTQYQIVEANNKSLVYFSLLSRAPEFFIGVLINVITINKDILNKISNILSVLGIILILASAVFLSELSVFPGLLAFPACIGAAFLIISKGGVVNKFLSTKLMVFIGELSYSIYLWHWPVLAFYRYYYCDYNIPLSHLVLLLLLIFIMSYVSYRLVETYFRKLPTKPFFLRFVSIPVCMIILLYVCVKINIKVNYIDIEYSSPEGLIGWETHNKQYKSDIIRGDINSNDTILLLGDSHALGFATFLDEVGKKNHFGYRSITNDRYPPIPGLDLIRYPISSDSILEKESSENYIQMYEKMSSIAKKYISQSKVIVFVKSYDTNLMPSMAPALDELIRNLSKNQNFILVSDFPILDKNPIRLNRGITKNKSREFDISVTLATIPSDIIHLSEKYSNVHILDISNSIAFENIPYFNDTIMYYDRSHLNAYGQKKYAEYSGGKLMALLDSIKAVSKRVDD